MAEKLTVTVHLGPTTHRVELVFHARLLKHTRIGGLVLSAKRARFKRGRGDIPLWLVGHELVHVAQAVRLGWRYLPTYLWRGLKAKLRGQPHPMEVEAHLGAWGWVTNGKAWDARAYPVPRTWTAAPMRITEARLRVSDEQIAGLRDTPA